MKHVVKIGVVGAQVVADIAKEYNGTILNSGTKGPEVDCRLSPLNRSWNFCFASRNEMISVLKCMQLLMIRSSSVVLTLIYR